MIRICDSKSHMCANCLLFARFDRCECLPTVSFQVQLMLLNQ